MPELREDILPEQVEILAYRGFSTKDIADFYECDPKTIRNRFPEMLAKGRARRRGDLRDAQWRAATQNLNATLLIWLGKNDLGQSDFGLTDDDEEEAPFKE